MRNIIQQENGKMVHSSRFEIYQHIITKNLWEYYLEEADEYGVAFGYVMGDFNEWGDVDLNEIKPYIVSIVRGDELNYIMPPIGYGWEDELQDVELDTLSAARETLSPSTPSSEHSLAE